MKGTQNFNNKRFISNNKTFQWLIEHFQLFIGKLHKHCATYSVLDNN